MGELEKLIKSNMILTEQNECYKRLTEIYEDDISRKDRIIEKQSQLIENIKEQLLIMELRDTNKLIYEARRFGIW